MTRPTFVRASEGSRFTIFPGVNIRTAAGLEIMLSDVLLEPGAIVAAHAHPHEQVGMVLSGSATFFIGHEQSQLTSGDMYFIPGNVPHRVIAGEEGCRALDVFHPVREDYL